ncbi:LOW QUALITY PROTEIN: hypothetical protein PHMEG_0007015 [Phytophthora megakarya]|uniref:Uncharacterized protein n=1 Tax=Phytophthora megakarya TaxID=4795 RepID=A0A225WP02_9STRA|nr:LOW QUALITY PROTEIN: hypothetical protein PHMEG_0007015 [Phytophthora megakarya]
MYLLVSAPSVETAKHRSGFNLETFLASLEPEEQADRFEEEPTSTVDVVRNHRGSRADGDVAVLAALREENSRLQQLLQSQSGVQQQLTAGATGTAPNARGELPPPSLPLLSCSSFPEGQKKAKGEYSPPQAHLLAAGCLFKSLVPHEDPISYAECIKFVITPVVLMALFSGRMGSRGLTLLHFREVSEMDSLVSGSNNSNFASDFSSSVQLPPAPPRCDSYDDILDGIQGLAAFGNEFWFDHGRKLTSRLRVFVAKNKSADTDNNPTRVRLTLLYANKFLGNALGYLQSDSPHWWHSYCEALRAVNHQSPEWALGLVSALTSERSSVPTRRDDGRFSRREPNRGLAVPDDIRRLISVNRRGQEPCLLNVAGLSCSGGSRDRCGNSRRAHNWPDRLPGRGQEWVDKTPVTRAAALLAQHLRVILLGMIPVPIKLKFVSMVGPLDGNNYVGPPHICDR